MRRTVIPFALVLLISAPATAQEWTEYQNIRDGFKALFPGQPTLTETTWRSQAGFMLPERMYTAERGRERYSVRVVDYTGVERLGLERVKTCPAGSETCNGSEGLSGVGYWKHDVRGTLLYAVFAFIKRDVEVTDLFWNQQDLVSGAVLQLTSTADQSRSHVYIAMHEMKLYIAEATVPKGYPEPALFVQAVGWLDKDGNGIRYRNLYSHDIHGLREAPVPAAGRGNVQGQPPGDGGAAGGAGGRGDGAGDARPR